MKFAINTDSHATVHLDYLRYGVGTAQRGWLTAGRRDQHVAAVPPPSIPRRQTPVRLSTEVIVISADIVTGFSWSPPIRPGGYALAEESI